MHKHTINSTFLEIQWQTYNRYFSRKFELIDTLEDIKNYKEEMFNYSQLLDMSEENKYTDFINEKIECINKIEKSILKKESNNGLVVVKENKLQKIIRLVKNIIFRAKQYETN